MFAEGCLGRLRAHLTHVGVVLVVHGALGQMGGGTWRQATVVTPQQGHLLLRALGDLWGWNTCPSTIDHHPFHKV